MDPAATALPEPERAALYVADAMVDIGGAVPDPVWEEAKRFWNDTALVEIVVMAATFAYFNRIANALEIEPTA